MRAAIVLSILAAFIIAFSLLSLSLFLYHYNFEDGKWVLQEDSDLIKQKSFLSHNVPANQKKIFLIGSSQVMNLNPILIRDDLQKNKLNYTVYNLAVSGDVPTLRLKTIDFIISAKPAMIVYGMSDRDFRINEGLTNENEVNLLPNIHNVLGDWLDMQIANSRIDSDYLSSPKWDFLKFTFGINNTHNFNQESHFDPSSDSAWLEERSKVAFAVSDVILEAEKLNIDNGFQQMLPLDENKNFLAFKMMIRKLQDNKIPVIIFVTPQEKHRLEKLPRLDQFNLALNNISKEFPDVPIYSLWNKYAEQSIWTNITHVIPNTKKTGRIYSDDVAKMVTVELGVHQGGSKNDIPPKFSGDLKLYAQPLLVLSFPISDSTLLSIWKERNDLQKAFPEVANGNFYNLKMWAGRQGWNEDKRLAALIPPGEVSKYLDASLLSIWKERTDLQKGYPEVTNGNLTNLKKWASTYGWNEDKRLVALAPPDKIPSYLQKASFPISNSTLLSIWNERNDLQKAFPEVANGNLDNLKNWATSHGWNEDKRLAALIPPETAPTSAGDKP